MSASTNTPLLRVRNLEVTFPPRRGNPAVRAVHGVSFDLEAGQTLALVGESGSGKTTTGRAILQLQKTSGGSVELLGRDLTAMSGPQVRAMRRHMQFVLQNPHSSLNPRMRIASILSEPLLIHHPIPREQYAAKVDFLLEMVGLDPAVRNRFPHEFSGGQRQRIVIARALAVDPDFVVFDEAVSALDVRTQAHIVTLLADLQARLNLSSLFISHDLALVRRLADRVAVMYGGRIVEMGSAAQVYENTVHPYTRALLDAVPVPDVRAQRKKLRQRAPTTALTQDYDPHRACAFGENHAQAGAPEWHEIAPGHGVSCQFWPEGRIPKF